MKTTRRHKSASTFIVRHGLAKLLLAAVAPALAFNRRTSQSARAVRSAWPTQTSARRFAARMGLPLVLLCAALPATACDLANLVYPFFRDPFTRVIDWPDVVTNVNPLGCNGGSTLVIGALLTSDGYLGATLRNEGGLDNESGATIRNGGVFDSPGTFRNGGLLENYGTALQLRGTTVNDGTVNLYSELGGYPTGPVRLSGSFVNNGVIYGYGAAISTQGVFDNGAAGEMQIDYGSLEVANGTLNNSGTLSVTGGSKVQNGSSSDPTALLTNPGQLNLSYDSRVENQATIENSGYFWLQAGASLVSSGTFSNRGHNADLWNASGSTFTTTGLLSNDGSIRNGNDRGGATPTMVIAGKFLHDGTFVNHLGEVVFADTSSTTGIGTYTQSGSDSLTQLDGGVHIARIDLFGGRLCGNGSTSGTLLHVDGGTICPGHSPGTLTLGDLEFVNGVIELQIAGTAAGQFDVLIVGGRASFAAGTLDIEFIDGFLPQAGDQWQLLVFGGEVTGLGNLAVTFGGLPEGYHLAFSATDAGWVLTAVPEPGSCALALVGLAFIAFVAGRRQIAFA